MSEFEREVIERISIPPKKELAKAADEFIFQSVPSQYTYNYFWMGRPIIQYPQDIVAIQELIWRVKPDLILEIGIAHGGSLILSASILALIEMGEAIESKTFFDPSNARRRVLGVDIEIRDHNRKAIEGHVMSSRIDMIEASSIAEDTIRTVQDYAKKYQKIMVFLDSNHTHEHVLSELMAYANLISLGSYCVVFDTLIENLPKEQYPNRPWGPSNSPGSAVNEFLSGNANFKVDEEIDNKLLISSNKGGYLKRVA
jgi:cephalosporin hydroxylase